jgi:hypothetical protein
MQEVSGSIPLGSTIPLKIARLINAGSHFRAKGHREPCALCVELNKLDEGAAQPVVMEENPRGAWG